MDNRKIIVKIRIKTSKLNYISDTQLRNGNILEHLPDDTDVSNKNNDITNDTVEPTNNIFVRKNQKKTQKKQSSMSKVEKKKNMGYV